MTIIMAIIACRCRCRCCKYWYEYNSEGRVDRGEGDDVMNRTNG
ncbi:MAG: hypothetical protein ACK4FV_00535 [Candidatus Nitrosocaldus sp.]